MLNPNNLNELTARPPAPPELIRALGAAVSAGAGYFFGGWDGFLYGLTVLTILDYLTGTARAAAHKQLSSAIGARGVLKKLMIFALVGAAHTIDAHVLGNAAGGTIRGAVLFFYTGAEGLSILENAAFLGLPIPPRLRDALRVMHTSDVLDPGFERGKL